MKRELLGLSLAACLIFIGCANPNEGFAVFKSPEQAASVSAPGQAIDPSLPANSQFTFVGPTGRKNVKLRYEKRPDGSVTMTWDSSVSEVIDSAGRVQVAAVGANADAYGQGVNDTIGGLERLAQLGLQAYGAYQGLRPQNPQQGPSRTDLLLDELLKRLPPVTTQPGLVPTK